MYCSRCGIYNPDPAASCSICANPTRPLPASADQKVSADLTIFPFKAILRSLKGVSPLFLLILIPVIAVLYYIGKLFGKPFYGQILNSHHPKYEKTTLEDLKRLHKKTVAPVLSYLADQGFEHVADLEDKSLVQGAIQRFMVNRTQKIFCAIHISKNTGRLQYATFFAFTSDNAYYSSDNTFMVPIEYPKNVIVRHFPDHSVRETHEALLTMLSDQKATPILINQKSLLMNGCRIRRLAVERGLQQGVLHQKETDAAVCYHHPFQSAVRLCSACSIPICEACYTLSEDRYYCPDCLPESVAPVRTPAVSSEQIRTGYSGFGVRALAFLIDCAVIALMTGAVFTSVLYAVRLAIPDEAYTAVSFIAAQLFGTGFAVGYFIISVYKYGATIGQKLLGLRLTDGKGNLPDFRAGIVRFAYLLFSILFIFPAIGYFAILFRKTKQGFHDQLAGTFVITKHPIKKALLSWIILGVLISGAAWRGYQIAVPWISFLPFFSGYTYKTEVALNPEWVREFDKSEAVTSYIRTGNRFIFSTNTDISAIDLNSGDTIWTIGSVSRPIIRQLTDPESCPLIAVEYTEDGNPSVIRIDPDSGTILWKIRKEIQYLSVVSDGGIVYLYNNQKIAAVSLSGNLIWEKNFEDTLTTELVIPNKDILIERISETARHIICLSHQTGDIIWEMKNTSYSTGLTIGSGYHCLYSDKGQTALMYIPEKHIIWESQSGGYMLAHSGIPFDKERTGRSVFFSDSAALSGEDGSVRYLYPKGTRFSCITEDYAIVLSGDSSSQSEIILLEKHSGAAKKTIRTKRFLYLTVIYEDDGFIYLGGNVRSDDMKRLNTETELIIIDKQTLDIRELLCGNNLNVHQFAIFPGNRLFIASFQQVGMYKIPEIPAE